ncbi:MAG: hypothetical protein VXV96_08310 [Bdellovibrionota bacterium]|nr:hypothetical protein [Bdellovibrionota bacterium]
MWSAEYQKEFIGIEVKSIWNAWVDVNNWPKWDKELEKTLLESPFEIGTKFLLKPKGGPNVTIEITEINPLKTFTAVARFPLAEMHNFHELIETENGLIIKSKISVTGALGWLWRIIVVQGVTDVVPKQLEELVNYVKKAEAKTR